MTTNISADNERLLEDAVRNGLFKDKEAALAEALRLLSEKTHTDATLPADVWRETFRRHLETTPATSATLIDDSRDSIYAGRGE